jgi:hypothetical protein
MTDLTPDAHQSHRVGDAMTFDPKAPKPMPGPTKPSQHPGLVEPGKSITDQRAPPPPIAPVLGGPIRGDRHPTDTPSSPDIPPGPGPGPSKPGG